MDPLGSKGQERVQLADVQAYEGLPVGVNTPYVSVDRKRDDQLGVVDKVEQKEANVRQTGDLVAEEVPQLALGEQVQNERDILYNTPDYVVGLFYPDRVTLDPLDPSGFPGGSFPYGIMVPDGQLLGKRSHTTMLDTEEEAVPSLTDKESGATE
ncbi:uncharacterized protein LOC128208723 [Mya arenaria]|uniref:uncharacterized protein LOC128208723 n=1 Tax=Mya arenaria TaxID=6604 RepID=UPI0022E8025C|nr:uncharacterized protein LOC128208723 [Mya arenaria]